MLKLFVTFINIFSVPHNYFDKLTKLFSDLHPAKFLDTSAKSVLSMCGQIRALIEICEHTQTKIKK